MQAISAVIPLVIRDIRPAGPAGASADPPRSAAADAAPHDSGASGTSPASAARAAEAARAARASQEVAHANAAVEAAEAQLNVIGGRHRMHEQELQSTVAKRDRASAALQALEKNLESQEQTGSELRESLEKAASVAEEARKVAEETQHRAAQAAQAAQAARAANMVLNHTWPHSMSHDTCHVHVPRRSLRNAHPCTNSMSLCPACSTTCPGCPLCMCLSCICLDEWHHTHWCDMKHCRVCVVQPYARYARWRLVPYITHICVGIMHTYVANTYIPRRIWYIANGNGLAFATCNTTSPLPSLPSPLHMYFLALTTISTRLCTSLPSLFTHLPSLPSLP